MRIRNLRGELSGYVRISERPGRINKLELILGLAIALGMFVLLLAVLP